MPETIADTRNDDGIRGRAGRGGESESKNSTSPFRDVLRPGETVCRKAVAERVAFLVDADAFYTAFVEAALEAQNEIFIVGWDTDSRTELPAPENLPAHFLNSEGKLELGFFLAALTRERPQLRVFVLTWDFAFIYLFERESWPSLRFSQFDADRLHFVLDREHPALASHHQKIVVIDNCVAFSGGLDLTQRRWDTPEHKGEDPRRVDPGGHRYGPFHDVQICVSVEAARALGDLARERWRLATGEAAVSGHGEPTSSVIWPPSAKVEIEKIEVALSRTLPSENFDSARVDEVERLFLESIARVQKFAYIENQYFTCPNVARAIAKRLEEETGPEFVMVLPRDQTGWIEESTMGLLRSTALKIVREADRHGRFRCYYPVVPGLKNGYVKVHSKVMILDDEFIRIGSANLNNRSMGLDTECDVSILATGRSDAMLAARELRLRLLAEHLDVTPSQVEQAILEKKSLVKGVESLIGRPRTLIEMSSQIAPWVEQWAEQFAPPPDWIDPSAPRGIRRWFLSRMGAHPILWGTALATLLLAGLLLLARIIIGEHAFDAPAQVVAWFRSVDSEKISGWVAQVQNRPWTIPVVIAGMAFFSLIFIPITVMILGIALSFGRYESLFISMSGSMIAASITYGIGRYWAYSKSGILQATWVKRASEELSRGGLLTVAAVRLAPIAPFTIVNVVSGVLRVPVRNFFVGTFLGLLPGVCVITFLSQTASESLRNGGLAQNGMKILSIVAGLGLFVLVCRFFKKSSRRTSST